VATRGVTPRQAGNSNGASRSELLSRRPAQIASGSDVTTLRHLHQMMNERRSVQLSDGRVGKIVRVDTLFPDNAVTVTVWTVPSGPSVSKVSLSDVVGAARHS
jgi:hypothetical protein